ncbi:hypothetical protein BKA64DRAFT_207069 [Cadophora sp. MPI-SDFR-AT-0126]|nr:hypothetical protein BKA64DRAFT_207069 [Leotiomycetes sp. MPI-SDFR-AT-0126]
MDNNASAVAPVQAQLGIDSTTFKTAESLRELISIASRPNVQPQAVLAVEQLGFSLLASPERIDDAIVALRGNDSVRVESAQAWIGLRAGELHRIFRESTPLLQFFLLFAACKTCYADSEIGDIAFGMVVKAGVLKRYPVASEQLTQLLRVLSSHAEFMAPITVMHEIAVAADGHRPKAHLYGHIEPGEVADIFVQVFRNLVDDMALEVMLTGTYHGVWLATVFSWLLPKEVCVVVDNETIRGSPGAKLTINIIARENTPWRLDVWRSDGNKSPRGYVFETDRGMEMRYPKRFPISQAKFHFGQLYISLMDQEIRPKAIAAIGDVAGALTWLLAEHGKLYLDKSCCRDRQQKCSITYIKDVLSDASQTGYSRAVTKYGWSDLRMDEVNGLYQIISKSFQEDHTSPRSAELVVRKIKEACSNFFRDAIGEEIVTDGIDLIVDPASYIALDAIVTSTANPAGRGCNRYMSLDAAANLNETDEIIGALLSENGLNIKSFRRLSFAHLLPGITEFHDRDLVVTQNGYVAGMAALWDCSASQKDALQIRYTTGHIQRDTITYTSIREADSGYHLGKRTPSLVPVDLAFLPITESALTEARKSSKLPIPKALSSMFPFVGDHQLSLPTSHRYSHPSLFPESEDLSFTTRVSIQGSVLMIKHYIQRPFIGMFVVNDVQSNTDTDPDKVERRSVSWIDSVLSLATATHVARDQELMGGQGNILINRLAQDGIAIHRATPFYNHDIDNSSRIILNTSNESIRFFAAGQSFEYYSPQDECFILVIRHGSLLSSISVAHQALKPWVIVS